MPLAAAGAQDRCTAARRQGADEILERVAEALADFPGRVEIVHHDRQHQAVRFGLRNGAATRGSHGKRLGGCAALGAPVRGFGDFHLFAGVLMAWLEKYMQISVAEVIARLLEIAIPVVGLILLMGALYRFLRREIERQFINEDARLELAHRRTEGVALRNRCIPLTTGLSEWIAECRSWSERVIETIKKISRADAEWFKTLDAVPPPRLFLESGNPEQILTYRVHDFYLVKLEELIKKYG